MKRPLAVLLLALPAAAIADEVYVKGGGRISGIVVERTGSSIVIEVSAGRVTLPLSRVDRVTEGASALAAYRERVRRLAADDAAAWLALGLWARDQGLQTQGRHAFERVLAIDAANAAAHRALGHVLFGERWLTPEESYRARGYVLYEGRWVTPEEREDAIREHAERAAADRARTEAEARIREAEARAQAAEAEARRAREASSRVPLGWVLHGGLCCAGSIFSPALNPQPPPAMTPPPAPRPVSRASIRSRQK